LFFLPYCRSGDIYAMRIAHSLKSLASYIDALLVSSLTTKQRDISPLAPPLSAHSLERPSRHPQQNCALWADSCRTALPEPAPQNLAARVLLWTLCTGLLIASLPPAVLAQNIVVVPTIHTIAGNGTTGNGADGIQATQTQINNAQETAIDRAGNVFFNDFGTSRVRRVDAITGIVTTVAGNGTSGYNGDNKAATSAELNFPEGLSIDSSGNLYVADKQNCRIREVVAATGLIKTVAGNGTCGYTGDGAAATSAQINFATGVAIDSVGNIYIADQGNDRIRKVTLATGVISTIAGTGTAGYNGDNIAATSAQLEYPFGVRVDPKNNICLQSGHRCYRPQGEA
jgi:sugar lactone lactonase YvrE